MMAETFGQMLRRFRTRAGLTISELAMVLGASRRSITCWEQDQRVPRDRARLLDLARVLDLSTSETAQFTAMARRPSSDQNGLGLVPTAAPIDGSTGNALWRLDRRHQLRAPVADFVGRTAEITHLIAALQAGITDGGAATIVGMQGMGGIGKTELAYRVAHELRPTFPDAQIVLTLGGSNATPLTSAQALQAVIHAFTPDVSLPDELLTLEQHYRTMLHDRRALILADDARDAAQVQSLIPPAGSALLVTSRQRFTLPGMVMIDLEQLADTDAVALLRHICLRLCPSEAQTLAQACGYLPLALRVSGSILRTTPALLIGTYLARLADTRQRLTHLRDPDDAQLDVESSLAVSYVQLDVVTQQVFRQLGVFVADFATELAQATVVVPEGKDVTALLERLLRRNLVMYDQERVRWRLHDLVRDLARQYLEGAGELESAMWRYVHATVRIVQALHDQYLISADGMLASLAQFDAERRHIDIARAWTMAHAGTPDGDQLILAMALATTRLAELRFDVERERIPLLASALAVAQRLGQRFAEGQLLLSLGRAIFDLGTTGHAIAYWEQALDIFQELGDHHNEGLTLGNLGTAYARLGDPQRAIPAYEQALALFRAFGDRRHEGQVLGNLGAAYAELEEQAAILYLEEALLYACTVGDRRFEGMLLHALGDLACTLGEPQRALGRCEAALAIVQEIGDRQQEGYTLTTLGCAHTMLNEHADAITAFDQALTILQDIGDRWGIATCQWHYGLALADRGDYQCALPLLRASVAYMAEIEHAQAETRMALVARLEVEAALPDGRRTQAGQRAVGSDVAARPCAATDH